MPRLSSSVTALFAGALLTLLPIARSAAAQCGPRSLDRPARREHLLVSPAWLAAHANNPGLVILQVGDDGFRDGHIPGARPIDPMALTAGDHDLAPVDRLRDRVAALGVSDDSRVVLYGDPWHTGLVFWTLEYLGLVDRVSVLDGGLAAWRTAGHPVAIGAVPAATRGTLTPRSRPDLLATAEWIRERLSNRGVVIIDGRTGAEYAGTAREDLPRTGHIPGARHLDWSDTFTRPGAAADSGVISPLVPADRLAALFERAGARPGTDVVLYCTVGLRASHLYFVARYLGYTARMYDGSWSEWSRRADLPMTRGDQP
jgi:thiosulfate/3-mercaptopyruvate sulfurtransferase